MTETPDAEYPSPVMQKVLTTCGQAAATDISVLLLGESGTGKDFLSKYIRRRSRRAEGPFFAVNCAAIAQELAESELFGHERGAFTGAVGKKKGLLEQADGGTCLLNEIGATSLALQAKILTFLDDKEFVRVGGETVVHVDVRIIAATSRDLQEISLQGRFLPDLLYRLEVFPIWVPPLRDRMEDIPVLVRELLTHLGKTMSLKYTPEIDCTGLQELASYEWPGNVRELRNILERALTLNFGKPVINAEMIIAAVNMSGDAAARQKQVNRVGNVLRVADTPVKPTPVEISDELLRRMIEEVFGDAPTPVEVVRAVLGWTRKDTSAAVKRVGCHPGKSGRLPRLYKETKITEATSWLGRRGIL